MKLKTFFGKSLQDAMRQAKDELGEDVVLINSQKVSQDGSNSNQVEIIAGLDVNSEADDSTASDARSSDFKRTNGGNQFLEFMSEQDKKRVLQTATEKDVDDEVTYLRQEVKNLKSRFRELTPHNFYGDYLNAYGQLLDSGVNPDHAASFVRHAFLNLGQERIVLDKILEFIKVEISKLFLRNSSRPTDNDSSERRVIVFIGPAGSGKTTAMMKMAISNDILGSKKVSLLSTDTYGLAAFEPLKRFSKLTSIPFLEVRSSSDAQKKLDRMVDINVVLVDMPGRTLSQPKNLLEMKECLSILKPTDVFLVMSATTDLKDMLYSIEQYNELKPTGLIFTKLDETRRVGKIISVMKDCQLPVKYISKGQIIPESLIEANLEYCWNKMMNSEQIQKSKQPRITVSGKLYSTMRIE